MNNLIEIVIHSTDAATATINKVQGSMLALGESAGGLSAALIGAGGVAAAFAAVSFAGVEMANRLSDQVEQLRNLSTRTGVSVNNLRVLQEVMKEAGMSPDQLNVALTMLNRNLADGKKGLAELVGGTHDTYTALMALSDAAKSGNAAAIAINNMGRGGSYLSSILPDLKERVKDVKTGFADLDDATLLAAKHWDDLMDTMGRKTKSTLDQIAAWFLKFMDTPAMRLLGANFGLETFKKPQDAAQPQPPPPPGPAALPSGFSGEPGEGLRRILAAWAASPDISGTASLRQTVLPAGDIVGLPKRLGWLEPANQKKIQVALQQTESDVSRLLTYAGLDIANSITSSFATIVTAGSNAAAQLRQIWQSLAYDMAKMIADVGLSWLLGFVGGAIGGPGGAFLGKIGGQLIGRNSMAPAGGTVIFQGIDAKSLRQQIQHPTGSFSRASQMASVGARR